MKAYITRINGWSLRDKSHYVQQMVAEIAHQLGYREMGIFRYNLDGESWESLCSRLDGIIAGINGGDLVICQFPTGNGMRFENELVNRVKAYGGRLAIFIQELEPLVCEEKQTLVCETIGVYNKAEVLIVPTYTMQQWLLENGIEKNMKFIVQEMWDYVVSEPTINLPMFKKEIYFTDNNGFTGMNHWNYPIPLKLYNVFADPGQNVQNLGEKDPYQLFTDLSVGGFGLIWYTDEYSRKYVEQSASFSLSRYLAAGIPVIVPKESSHRILVEVNHLGIVTNSLEEAVSAVEKMTEREYREYVKAVEQFAPALRNGYFTKRCLVEAMQAFYRRDMGRLPIPQNVYHIEDCAFISTVLHESYDGNLALSWCFKGKTDGFLIYDAVERVILYETRNGHQHYCVLKDCNPENGFLVMAYLETIRGKLIIAESSRTYFCETQFNMSPKVSLIIPAYNAENYIIRSIDTALAQSLADLEIIIVDDGSTDHTLEVIDWYARKYVNVVAIHQKNGGVSAARNTGIEYANGEYIAFMDNDDMIYPDMIKKLYLSAEKNNCDIAITSVYYVTEQDYKISIFSQYSMNEDVAIDFDMFFETYLINVFQTPVIWNKLYRSSLIKERRIPLIIYDDEAWTPYIISFADKICYLDEGLYEYDRSIRKETLIDEWENSNEEQFRNHKRAIMFYLENGNPTRLEKLKQLAKQELSLFSRVYNNDEYQNLWKQISKM